MKLLAKLAVPALTAVALMLGGAAPASAATSLCTDSALLVLPGGTGPSCTATVSDCALDVPCIATARLDAGALVGATAATIYLRRELTTTHGGVVTINEALSDCESGSLLIVSTSCVGGAGSEVTPGRSGLSGLAHSRWHATCAWRAPDFVLPVAVNASVGCRLDVLPSAVTG